MADRVCGHGLSYDLHVGFGEAERSKPQPIKVDFEARTDWRASAIADRSNPVVDYAVIDRRLKEVLQAQSWRLIESVAERISEVICTEFRVEQVTVRVTKRPADMPHCDGVSVQCSRTPADFVR